MFFQLREGICCLKEKRCSCRLFDSADFGIFIFRFSRYPFFHVQPAVFEQAIGSHSTRKSTSGAKSDAFALVVDGNGFG